MSAPSPGTDREQIDPRQGDLLDLLAGAGGEEPEYHHARQPEWDRESTGSVLDHGAGR